MMLDHHAVQELLGAYALDACEPSETTAIEAHLDQCPLCADEASLLADAAGWLGASDTSIAPPRLREPVLATTRSGAESDRQTAPTVALYAEQLAALDALLATVPEHAWDTPIRPVPGWTVRDLVSHLAATETRLAANLGAAPDQFPEHERLDVDSRTHAVVDALRAQPPSAAHEAWRDAADAVLRHLATLSDEQRREPCATYDVAIPLERLLVGRSFELWIHADDIREVLGRPLEPPTDAGMALLTTAAVRSIPAALRFLGRARTGQTAWIVLSGSGAGRWPLALGPGEEPGVPDVVISADAEAFCRLAGARLSAGELAYDVEGDQELATELLTAASAFARL